MRLNHRQVAQKNIISSLFTIPIADAISDSAFIIWTLLLSTGTVDRDDFIVHWYRR